MTPSRAGLLLAACVFLSFAPMACGDSAAAQPAETPTPDAQPPIEEEEEKDAAPPPNPLAEKFDALFTMAAAKNAFTGSVIVVEGGKTILSKGYGAAVRDPERANGPDTIFRVGSISKQFTAAAILALLDDGKLALTDPVSKHFPEIPKENLEKDGTEVTIHHLLNHTSGLPDAQSTSYFRSNVWKATIDKQMLIDATSVLPLVNTPGTTFKYLNYGYLLLAVIIERVAGTQYDAFLHDRFFEPLAMDDTGTLFPIEKEPRRAIGYRQEGADFDAFERSATFRDRDLTWAFGSGQLYSTTLDLAKWDRALAEGRVKQSDLLFRPNLSGYGYGWVIRKKGSVTMQWHNGALSPLGFASFVARVPSKDRFVGYLANLERTSLGELETEVAKLALE